MHFTGENTKYKVCIAMYHIWHEIKWRVKKYAFITLIENVECELENCNPSFCYNITNIAKKKCMRMVRINMYMKIKIFSGK